MNRYADLIAKALKEPKKSKPISVRLKTPQIVTYGLPFIGAWETGGRLLYLGRGLPLEKRMPGANAMELDYGQLLDLQQAAGLILRWWWQPMSLRLSYLEDGRGDFYRPDFMVMERIGILALHETKGFMREDARTKLKIVCALHPYRIVLVTRPEKDFVLTEFQGSFP